MEGIELSHGFRFRKPSAVFCIHVDHGLRFEFDPCTAEVTWAVEKAVRDSCPAALAVSDRMAYRFRTNDLHLLPHLPEFI